MKMRRAGLLAFTLTSVAALAAANAADMYRAPEPYAGGYKDGPVVQSWAGFYAGINGGGAWSANSDQLACPLLTCGGAFGGLSPSGGFGGGQIGYNWQGVWHPRLVFGIEADIQGAGISDKGTSFVVFTPDHFKSDLDYFGTVRGRLGYATDSTLVYFTGGFAYGGIRNEANFGAPFDFKSDTTATGYVLGGGLEYRLNPAWSIKSEYQFINLGKNDPADGFHTVFRLYTANGGILRDDAFHTVRAGLNYHILPAYEPLK